MKPPGIPADEEARIRALLEQSLLDTPPEDFLDECVALAAESCGVSTGAVSLIDRERQWFKAVFGRLPSETPRDVSFCGHVVHADAPMVVPDATADPRFADNPLVEKGVRFYAGVPLHGRDGQPLGTLCVIDAAPRELAPEKLDFLRLIAEKIEEYLSMRLLTLQIARLEASKRAESDALKELETRRRHLMAMMVHDLKNPLTVLTMAAEVVARDAGLAAETREALHDLLASTEVANRLVIDSLDLISSERGHLAVSRAPCDIGQTLRSLASRLRYLAEQQAQSIVVDDTRSKPEPVAIDSVLVSRAVRNFLDNSFKYAPAGLPIRVTIADERPDSLVVRVEDRGPTIPEPLRDQIFEPHVRTDRATPRPSHGLGLALCRAVARAHGGDAWVEPGADGKGNVFALRLEVPAARAA